MLLEKSGFSSFWFSYVLLLGCWPAHCYSQSSDGEAAYHVSFSPSKTGGTVVFSGPKHALAIDIASDDIRTTDNPNYLILDNRPFQASMVPLPNGMEGSSLPVARQKEILKSYVNYEMDYFQKEVKLATGQLKLEYVPIGDTTFLLWTFRVGPAATGQSTGGGNAIVGQLYLSVLWHDQVLDLNCALTDLKDTEKARALLVRTAGTLRSLPDKK